MFVQLLVIAAVAFLGANATDTPVIGILTQHTYLVDHLFPVEEYHSWLSGAYVKYLEGSGARVIPVWIGQNESYYRNVVKYTNGLLFPGGGTYFNETGGYGEAAKILYDIAKEANDEGTFYPIFGTVMGLQVLAYADANSTDLRINCNGFNLLLPLEFEDNFRQSHLFSKASWEIVGLLQNEKVTYNRHRYCLTKEALEEGEILENWEILSTNKDKNNLTYISALESKYYPFYGVQFHPEKSAYEFNSTLGVPHNWEAIKIGRYFADTFVEDSRKNDNAFPSREALEKSLIYNYKPVFSARFDIAYDQLYVFTSEDVKNILEF